MTAETHLEVRRATELDQPDILALLGESLGPRGERYEDFYRWKHLENAFGPSPSWVALDAGRIVGFRTFLRWRFRRRGEVVTAVRAVDTATHPDYQGRGIFTTLTLAALGELREEGVDLVFNTPNDKSRPGYLKMGWSAVGRLAAWGRFLSPGGVLRTARARVPAELWSLPATAGVPAAEVLDDAWLAPVLAASPADPQALRTDRTPEYLRWRYGFEPLHYRAVTGDGWLVVFRLRRRGPAVEAAVEECLAAPGTVVPPLPSVLSGTGADYALVLGRDRPGWSWFPLPGPVLTTRPVAGSGSVFLEGWDLSLGDVELF